MVGFGSSSLGRRGCLVVLVLVVASDWLRLLFGWRSAQFLASFWALMVLWWALLRRARSTSSFLANIGLLWVILRVSSCLLWLRVIALRRAKLLQRQRLGLRSPCLLVLRLALRHGHRIVLRGDLLRRPISTMAGLLQLVRIHKLLNRVYGIVIVLEAVCLRVPRSQPRAQFLLQRLRLLQLLFQLLLLGQTFLQLLFHFELLVDRLLLADLGGRYKPCPRLLRQLQLGQHQEGGE